MSLYVWILSNALLGERVQPWRRDDLISAWQLAPEYFVRERIKNSVFNYYNPHTGAYFRGEEQPMVEVVQGIPKEYVFDFKAIHAKYPGPTFLTKIYTWEPGDDLLQFVSAATNPETEDIYALLFVINFVRPKHYSWELVHVLAEMSINLGGFVLCEYDDIDYFLLQTSYPPFLGEDVSRNPLLRKYEDLWFRFFWMDFEEPFFYYRGDEEYEYDEDIEEDEDDGFVPVDPIWPPNFISPDQGETVEHLAKRILDYLFKWKRWPENIGSFPTAEGSSDYQLYYLWWRYMWRYPQSAQVVTPSRYHPAPVVPLALTEKETAGNQGGYGTRYIFDTSAPRPPGAALWGALCEGDQERVFIPSWVHFVVQSDRYTVVSTEYETSYATFQPQIDWIPLPDFIEAMGENLTRSEHGWLCEMSSAREVFAQYDAGLTLHPLAPGSLFIGWDSEE